MSKKIAEQLLSEVEHLRHQLKESEMLHQTLVQTNLYGIQEIDVYGNIVYTNSVLCEILGYSGGELKGKQIWNLLASEAERGKLTEHLTKLTQREVVPLWVGKYVKKKIKKRTRKTLELQQNWRYKQNDQGRIKGFISLTTDIVNYKQAQGEKGEENYRLIVEAMREMILSFDMHGRITYVNERATEALGYFKEEFLAMNIEDILPPEQLEKTKKELLSNHAAGDKELLFYRTEFINRNLKTLPVKVSASLITKENEPSDILMIASDLDQAWETVSEPERKGGSRETDRNDDPISPLIAESAREMILTFDMEGSITYVNQGAEELIGYFREEFLNMNIADLLPPEHLDMLRKRLVNEPAGNKEVMISQAEFINRGLKLIPIEVSSSLIIKEGRPSDILIIARDLSQHKKNEQELLRNEKFESLATLADGLADDMNNFLTGVMGNIELAQMGLEPRGKSHKILSYARKSCADIKNLARQFVIFSKGGTVIRKIGSLGELIKESADTPLADFHVRCDISISDDLWPVPFDEKQMRQVTNNLILNAAEAMPSGGQIKLLAENVVISDTQPYLASKMRPGKYVRLSVQDQGLGIREEYAGKIFDPYFSTKDTEEKKRRGLGLTVAYSVIRKHYGYVHVDSKPGIRTTFDIYLPVSKEKAHSKRKPKIKGKPAPIRGRLLIMDDEDIVIDVAGQMLNQLGYEISISKNGDEAIETYEHAMRTGEPFDAVILDLHVEGGMGGRETIKKLLKFDPHVRGIASSGYSNDPEITDFEKYGFSGAVEKPYSINELSLTLDEIMEKYETIEVMKSDWLK